MKRRLQSVVAASQVRFAHGARYESGGVASAARRQKLDHRHPLAKRDPATRSIVVPNSVHKPAGSEDTKTAAVKAANAKRDLLRRYEEEMLWSGTVVENDDHWLAQHVAKLRTNARYRYSSRMMVVAGRDVIRELNEQGTYPEHLLVPSGKGIPEWANGKGTEIVQVSRSVLESIAPGTDGYIGNFSIPEVSMTEELMANSRQLKSVLVLDNVDDPGTLGSLLRTAAGMAYDAVVLTHHCADLYDHRVVSAARGAHFQALTKFYTLNDTDGDDVYGMLNHMAERNNLTPTVFTPHSNEPAVASSGLPKKTLHEYCLEEYFEKGRQQRPSSAATKDLLDAGQMLIAGPDHKRTLAQRIAKQVRRPATLLDVDAPLHFALAAPIVMQALRPTASWDFQLPSTAENAMSAGKAEQLSTSRAQIGPDLLQEVAEPNMSLDEWEYAQIMKRVAQREERKSRYLDSDLGRWEQIQLARIQANAAAAHERKMYPFKGHTTIKPRRVPDNFPDHIAEMKEEGLDRDSLREVAKWAKSYTPPPNYDKRFKPAEPTIRRGRVVPTY